MANKIEDRVLLRRYHWAESVVTTNQSLWKHPDHKKGEWVPEPEAARTMRLWIQEGLE